MNQTAVMTIDEVADQLRIDRRTVYKMIEAGELHAFRTGRNWRVPVASLEALVVGTLVAAH